MKPYPQLGNALALAVHEQLVAMWHALDDDSQWSVEWQERQGRRWLSAANLEWTRVVVDFIPPHRGKGGGLKP